MQSHWSKRQIYESPIRLLIVVAITIFIAHMFTMALFLMLPHFAMGIESAVQSGLLLVLLFPALYFFSFRPLIQHMAERDRAEEAMRESEHKYRNLFEHLTDAAFLMDVETGRILDTNSQGERLLGRNRGEIMGLNQTKLYPPAQEQEQRERFAIHAHQTQPKDYETRIVRKDGVGVPVSISGIPTTLYGRNLILELFRTLTQGD